MAYQNTSQVAKPARERRLDSFHTGLVSLSDKLQENILRLEQVAIRFRGNVPKAEENKKDIPTSFHKIDDLERTSAQIDNQLLTLGSLISDLEDI